MANASLLNANATEEALKYIWPTISIPNNLAYRIIDGEVFCELLGPQVQDRYCIIGGIGADIFTALQQRGTLASLLDHITRHYEVDREEFMADLMGFLEEALNAGVLHRGNNKSTSKTNGFPRPKEEVEEDVLNVMYEKAASKARPLKIFLELTHKCNHRCLHCYLGGETTKANKGYVEQMSTERVLHLLEEMAESGVLELILTGGEPTLHPNFDDILRRAVELRFAVSVLTNGSRLDDDLVELLASVPLAEVRIPIYGLQEYHEHFVGNPSSFEKTIGALRALQEAGVHVVPTSILTKDNGNELIQLRSFLQEFNLHLNVSPLIFPTIHRGKAPVKQRGADDGLDRAFSELGIRLRRHLCVAGVSRFRVTPNGSLHPCEMIPLSFGNVAQGGFADVLNSSVRQEWIAGFNSLIAKKEEECKRCPIREHCVDCVGLSFLEGAQLTSKSAEACRLAHMSYRVWGA